MRADTPVRPLTWVLALLFLVLIDFTIRHCVLWPVATFEDTRDFGRIVFGQTYRAARQLYAPQPSTKTRVALIGDSRLMMAARNETLEREITTRRPDVDVKVHNLAIFGAAIGDLKAVSRHVAGEEIDLVVIAVDELSLYPQELRNVPASLMRTGWRDGGVAVAMSERVDRWLRTLWPLYRFREFARAAIVDRFLPDPTSQPWPERFPSMSSFLDYVHQGHNEDAEQAHRRWLREPTLQGFVSFLNVGRPDYVDWVRRRAKSARRLKVGDPAVRLFDSMLAELVKKGIPAWVLRPPRNPLLEQDRDGEFGDYEKARGANDLIGQVAARHGVPVIDASGVMPSTAYFDLDHLAPDLAGFEPFLAEQLADAL